MTTVLHDNVQIIRRSIAIEDLEDIRIAELLPSYVDEDLDLTIYSGILRLIGASNHLQVHHLDSDCLVGPLVKPLVHNAEGSAT